MSATSEADILLNIQRSLEEIKAILILLNQTRLDETKNGLLKEGSIKRQIYEMCDGTKTTRDIAAALGKEHGYVNSYLSILRRQGLIRSYEREAKQVHEQVF